MSKPLSRRVLRVIALAALCIVAAILALDLGFGLWGGQLPPDLTTCTRVEVQCGAGALNYFFPSSSMQKGVFNEEEREYIRSYDTWTVTDQEQIKASAHRIGQGTYTYLGWRWSLLMIAKDPPTKIVGYRPWGGTVKFIRTEAERHALRWK